MSHMRHPGQLSVPESIMCRVRLSDNGHGSVGRSSLPQSLSRSVNHRGEGGEGGEYLDLIIKWIRENRPAQADTLPGHVDQQTCKALLAAFAEPKLEVTTNQSSIFALCFDVSLSPSGICHWSVITAGVRK